ncbi:MAG: ABC transporter ATP-binding protein [Verrucomicrobiia bacterium]
MALLKIEELRKSFAERGTKRDVIQIDRFELAPGEELAIAGESGSGKTTFLNLIAGILVPDSGRIVVEGEDVAPLKEAARDRWRARNVGYVFQSFNLLQGYTCLENVLLAMSFGSGPDRSRAEELLRRVGLGERLHDCPRRLSSGQQQRVAVARALANRPKLVLADEPTGNLDARNAGDVIALIQETCQEAGAALLLVSHDRGVLERFPTFRPMTDINDAGRQR